jgi:hypothetical protein
MSWAYPNHELMSEVLLRRYGVGPIIEDLEVVRKQINRDTSIEKKLTKTSMRDLHRFGIAFSRKFLAAKVNPKSWRDRLPGFTGEEF